MHEVRMYGSPLMIKCNENAHLLNKASFFHRVVGNFFVNDFAEETIKGVSCWQTICAVH